MNGKPRIFVSAVSSEFQAARKKISEVLDERGFEPVFQEEFGTEWGTVRQTLQRLIDGCEGLIQLVGDAYGFAPDVPDETFGEISYTQFEFHYARQQGKKTWVIFAGEGCTRDAQPAEPERLRELQTAYRDSLRSGAGHIHCKLWRRTSNHTDCLQKLSVTIAVDEELGRGDSSGTGSGCAGRGRGGGGRRVSGW